MHKVLEPMIQIVETDKDVARTDRNILKMADRLVVEVIRAMESSRQISIGVRVTEGKTKITVNTIRFREEDLMRPDFKGSCKALHIPGGGSIKVGTP